MRREIDFETIYSTLCDLEDNLDQLSETVNKLIDNDVDWKGADRSVCEYSKWLKGYVFADVQRMFADAILSCVELLDLTNIDEITESDVTDITFERGKLHIEFEEIGDEKNEEVASAATPATNN